MRTVTVNSSSSSVAVVERELVLHPLLSAGNQITLPATCCNQSCMHSPKIHQVLCSVRGPTVYGPDYAFTGPIASSRLPPWLAHQTAGCVVSFCLSKGNTPKKSAEAARGGHCDGDAAAQFGAAAARGCDVPRPRGLPCAGRRAVSNSDDLTTVPFLPGAAHLLAPPALLSSSSYTRYTPAYHGLSSSSNDMTVVPRAFLQTHLKFHGI